MTVGGTALMCWYIRCLKSMGETVTVCIMEVDVLLNTIDILEKNNERLRELTGN